MILSSASPSLAPGGGLLLAAVALCLYVLAVAPALVEGASWRRFASAALLGAFALHLLLLVIDIGGLAGGPGTAGHGMRWGFGPVLSMTLWLMIAVHTVESRFLPLPSVRPVLALAGIAGIVAAVLFPGDERHASSALAPLHFALGVATYGLFAAAVLHASLLDRAERRLRAGAVVTRPQGSATAGLPLLQLERLTFRFVEAGFLVLTATLLLGALTAGQWRWDHKGVFSLLAWGVFAALLVGRHWRGWRGRHATRWLYVGAALLLLAYVGSRFVFEVILNRPPA